MDILKGSGENLWLETVMPSGLSRRNIWCVKPQKFTSKHIRLGFALHQQTRSENLLQLFNAENHTIVIIIAHGIGNAIAKYVLTHVSQIDKQI